MKWVWLWVGVLLINILVISVGYSESIKTAKSETNTTPAAEGKTVSPGGSVTVADLIGYDPSATATSNTSASDSKATTSSDTTAAKSAMTMSVMATSASESSLSPQKLVNNFHFDPTSGSGILSLPLYTPPGRKGIQPQVALTYSPRSGNGVLGYGWQIDFGYIERSTKNGVPTYGATDTFICAMAGAAMELVSLGNGDYQAKVEGGFMRFHFDGNTWEVKDKQGNTYYFGLDSVLQDQSRELKDSKIFRWHLSEVKDVHGNYYFVRHFQDGRFEVLYTGEPGTDRDNINGTTQKFQAKIVGEVESANRQDPILSYKSGFLLRQDKRLASVSVYAAGTLQRKYIFNYRYSSRTNRTLLATITEYGSDGTTAFPAMTMTYQDDAAPSYDVSLVNNDPTQGDNLLNVKFSHHDHNSNNEYVLYPNYNGNPDYGRFSDGEPVPWGPKYTQFSYPDDKQRHWDHESNGNFHYFGVQDTEFTAWTYAYLSGNDKPVNLSGDGDVYHIFLNGDYANARKAGPVTLKKGYNLIEITGYNQNDSSPFDLTAALATQVDLMNSSQVILPQFSADFNGDGLADVASFSPTDGKMLVALSQGTTFLPKEEWISGFGVNTTILLGDFNADGKSDICSYSAAPGTWRVALSDGTKFVDSGNWISNWGINQTPLTVDANGDGLADLVTSFATGNEYRGYIALNKGGRFESLPDYIWQFGPPSATANTPVIGDFNGDGVVDTVLIDTTNGNWQIGICPGNLVDQCDATRLSATNFGAGKNPVVADINSDGMTDIGYYNYDTGKLVYRLSKGTSLGDPQESTFAFNLRQSNVHIQSSDFNGDGLTDFIAYNELGNIENLLSRGKAPDLMASVNNGLGGKTSFVYDTSAHFANTYLPFALPVITSMTVENSLGDIYTTRYAYAKGYWDLNAREFWGFGEVKVMDNDRNYTKTEFLQDNEYLKGLPNAQYVYDAQDRLYSKTTKNFVVTTISSATTPPIKFPYVSRVDSFVYDGNATGRRSAQEFYYEESPQMGNLTRTVQLGEVDLSTGNDLVADSRTVETQHLNNTASGNYLVGLPKQTVVKNNAGDIIRKMSFYYDGHTDISALPTKGLMTKKVAWAGDGPGVVSPETQMTYDTYGNLLTTTSPRGRTSRVTYDSAFHLFPTMAENAKGQQVTTEYYGIAGVALNDGTWRGLWGQVKSTTDANNQKVLKSYDVFGRAVKSVSPLDSVDFPTVSVEYAMASPYMKVTTHQRINHGQSATMDSVEIYDGLGRLIQSKERSANNGQYIVAGQAGYNSRGLVEKKYLPRFTTLGLAEIDAIDPAQPHTLTKYDPVGRVIEVDNPDGTFSSVAYDDGVVTTIDANGHQQKSYADIFGRLVKKEEYVGADGRSSFYPAQAFALYATTTYKYDTEGNLIETRDAKNNVTTIQYDYLGRKVAMTDPDMGHWQYGYDLNGNLSWQIDAKNQRIDFTYDELDRLVNKNDAAALNVNYTYDEQTTDNMQGRLYKAQYGLSDQTRFFYDERGREVQSRKKIDGNEYAVAREYDALGRLTSVVYPQGEEVVYTYDAAGQVKAVGVHTNTGTIPEPPQRPSATQITSITPYDTYVVLTWSASEGATGYKVKYGTTSGQYTFFTDEVNETTMPIGTLVNGLPYYFVVVACNQYGESAPSDEKSATPVAAPPAPAEITLDAKSSIQADNAAQLNLNHTVGAAGTNRALVVAVSLYNFGSTKPSPAVSLMTYAGQPMTLIKRQTKESTASKYATELWYILNPTVGTNAIQATFNGTTKGITMAGISLTGVKQQAPEAFAQASGSGTSLAVNIQTITADAWVIDSFVGSKYSATMTAGSGQTEFCKISNFGDLIGFGSYKTAAQSTAVSMAWTSSLTQNWAGVAAVFAPAPSQSAALDAPQNMQQVLYRVRSGLLSIGKAVANLFCEDAWAATTSVPLDYTTFTEQDAGNKVSVTSSCASFANVETKRANAYLWKNYSTAGDFVYEFDGVLTAADTFAYETVIWGVSNTPNESWDDWTDGINLAFKKSGTNLQVKLNVKSGSTVYADWLTMNTRYYFRVKRVGSTVSAEIYSDLGRTTLVKTLTATSSADFQYLYGFNTQDSSSTGYKATGDVCRLTSVVAATGSTAPTLNSAQAGNKSVALSWSAVSGAAGYRIKYGTSSGNYTKIVETGSYTDFTVGGLRNKTVYYFVVVAYDQNGESPASNEKNAMPVLPTDVSLITNVEYNAAGQVKTVTYGNGLVTEYEYNEASLRLRRVTTTNASAQVLQDFIYSYDSVGNILSITDGINTATQTFKYDAFNRLVEATGAGYGTKTYAYNEIGNMTAKEGVGYVYAENGAGPHAVTSLNNGTRFSYDTNGNMVSKVQDGVTTEFSFDAENRLTKIKKNGGTVAEYGYDGDGGRVKKVMSGTTTATTRYVGSLFEITNDQATQNIYLGGKRLASVVAGELVYYLDDHLGGTNVVTDYQGARQELVEYMPYGSFSRQTKYGTDGVAVTNYFTGQKLDEDVSLYYYGARYYDPSLGRFITPDSIVQSPGGNPQTFNRYSYCGNNPVNFTDPSGHWFFAAIAAIFKAVVGAIAAHPVIAGAVVGGASGGIQSYQATGTVSPFSIGMGAVMGGLAGGTLGMSGAELAKIGQAGFLLNASAGFSLASQVMGAAGLDDVSQGFQYAAMGTGAAFLGYNMGIGIRDWAASKGTFYDVQSGSVLSKEELASRYGRGGAKIFTNGITQSQGDALSMAGEQGANVLFYNPTSGSIADLTESLLGKMTFTESLSRQIAGVSLKNAAYIGYSQGSIITSNALLGMVHNGGRGVAAGSSLTMLAPAVSQARVYFSAYEAGIRSVAYNAKLFDVINLAGPNLSPINFVGGTIGATTTYGLKVHSSY